MKVTKSEENLVEFDNGLCLVGDGDVDCCANNYLDFEQLPVGTELPTMTVGKFIDSITIKEDGFSVKAEDGTPKWVQARSDQNGYYSDRTALIVKDGSVETRLAEFSGEQSNGY